MRHASARRAGGGILKWMEPRAQSQPLGRRHADLESALAAHRRRFEAEFGHGAPPRLFFAPGRVNLMGAHLDYNGGPVMPLAIDRGTFVAVRERADRRIRLRSTLDERGLELEVEREVAPRAGCWFDYPAGVLRAALGTGRAGAGLDVLFGGNLPIGAGLSSSASICVATAQALDAVWRLEWSPLERVEVALAAERTYVGVHCGIMDPYAVGLARPGHILWLDCKDRSTEHLPLDSAAVRVAVADTGVRRELAQGAFNQRVAEAEAAFEALAPHAPAAKCLRDVPREVLERQGSALDPVLRRRAQHVIAEVQRTFDARAALLAGDLRGFGRRMLEAHRSLRELYEVSVEELDRLVQAAEREEGVLGARLTGAGFGGCVAMLLSSDAGPDTLERIAGDFERRFAHRPAIEVFGGDPGPRELAPA
jgi:galactokinase